MVQYVFTPWRDREELLVVRRQFYDSNLPPTDTNGSDAARSRAVKRRKKLAGQNSREEGLVPGAEDVEGGRQAPEEDSQRRQDRRQAVARVSMWMQRGNCPHMVESTALLTAAMLSDEGTAADNDAGSTTYAVRAAYSAAFSRFVTGLLDGHQDKQRKQSMYAIAKTIGLPATFVELRHQSTHEQLPSLAKLRSAAQRALDWIWNYYWRQLSGDGEGDEQPADPAACREAVLRYLREEAESSKRKIMKQLGQWETAAVLKAIAELQERLPGNQVYLKCLRLSNDLLAAEKAKEGRTEGEAKATEAETVGQQISTAVLETSPSMQVEDAATAEESVTGWSRYEGPWKPKPIGMI